MQCSTASAGRKLPKARIITFYGDRLESPFTPYELLATIALDGPPQPR